MTTTPHTVSALAPDPDWWRGAVIYQIYPRSFQDTSGDGSGDLAGVASRLEYVASLGVDAVWLSPFFKSPMEDMGYDVSDHLAVDPMFGTMADFDAIVAEAHRLGLKVIIDQVLSHTSDRHEWFGESRATRDNAKADWYVWADAKPDGGPPNNWLSVFGGPAWEWDATRRQYYFHSFLASQPDLNFHNREVQDAMLETVRFWLERGVDGFRFDTVNHYFHDAELRDNPPLKRPASAPTPASTYEFQDHLFDKTRPENIAFLMRLRKLLEEYGIRISVGEVGDGPRSLQTVAAYTSAGDKLHMSYTFDLLGPEFFPAHFRKCAEDFEEAVADGWVCWAFSNHDVPRHISRWTPPGGDTDRIAKFSIALLAAMRGTLCIYQGEELGLTEAELAYEDLRDPVGIRFWPGNKGRDGARTPMPWEAEETNAGFSAARPWLPVPPQHCERAVSVQRNDPASVLSAYRDMIALRKTSPALAVGTIDFLHSDEEVLVFARRAPGETLLCAFNFSEIETTWRTAPHFSRLDPALPFDLGARHANGRLEMPPHSVFLARAE